MGDVCYVCKYTPVELLTAMGADCQLLNGMLSGFELADQVAGANICGFGKTVIEAAMSGQIRQLVLVNCCDAIRSAYDVLLDWGGLDFLFMMDMLHCDGACARELLAQECKRLMSEYAAYSGREFDEQAFHQQFTTQTEPPQPYVAILGARMGDQLQQLVRDAMPIEVRNMSCVGNRGANVGQPPLDCSLDDLMLWYAGQLFCQTPCMRMTDITGRRALIEDPMLQGIVYHTVKFCDLYSFEYADIKDHASVPLLKIESDYTTQSTGQLATRLEAFAETLQPQLADKGLLHNRQTACSAGSGQGEEGLDMDASQQGLFAGIDSGSTSTDVVLMDAQGQIVSRCIIPTGAGASTSAEQALAQAVCAAGVQPDSIVRSVATGYGRSAIQVGDKSITEISCHARGARYLDSNVRCVIDIGGQDSKVIALSPTGSVENFAMNDKCAAGTGRFLEMMAHTLQMELDQLSRHGLTYREDITISSTCSVFAESEVVGLIAQDKQVDDIVHGLNKAVAKRTVALVRRVGGQGPFMMTGGVSKNAGLVKALQQMLGEPLVVTQDAQLCGAIGAALYAKEMA